MNISNKADDIEDLDINDVDVDDNDDISSSTDSDSNEISDDDDVVGDEEEDDKQSGGNDSDDDNNDNNNEEEDDEQQQPLNNNDNNNEDDEDNDYDSDIMSDSGSEDDNKVLQKLSSDVNGANKLSAFHPEINSINNEEILALARVVRDIAGNICDPLHRTNPILTKFEKTRVLGVRAEQLNRGALPLIAVDDNIIHSQTIAEMEFDQNKIPFIIGRPIPNGGIEYWHLRDLEKIH